MQADIFPLGPLQSNCVLLRDEAAGEALVIDPGVDTPEILEILREGKLQLKAILLTHGHFDHVGGAAGLTKEFGAEVRLNREDLYLYENAPDHGARYGLKCSPQPAPGNFLEHGTEILLGGVSVRVLHTPGHSPGSVCFHVSSENLLITGDTLFKDSVGRTDLWRGCMETLLASIAREIMTLPGDTRVIPGHGPETRVSLEKSDNPFLHGLSV
ncbi:MAG: MBL fold metallo-hydrolase [Planctomycetes bacterium]|nr:MBL fold metallo-hydrolase [Planctomycetota bacterium]